MTNSKQKHHGTVAAAQSVAECSFERENGEQAHTHVHEDGRVNGEAHHAHHSSLHTLHVHRPQQRKALLWCLVLTNVMMVVEFAAGWYTGSLMLISDAIHMMSHALALGVSWLAILFAHRPASKRFPFGLYRIEILAAAANGIGLAGFAVWIVYEAIEGILSPAPIAAGQMTLVAVLGLLVNLTTALILHRSGIEDLNTRSAFLHMLADTYSSVAIVLGGIIIMLTDLYIIDPILSLIVALVVGKWSLSLLRESLTILLEAKPNNINIEEIEKRLQTTFPEIRGMHNVHVWEITSQYVCLSAHVVVADNTLSVCDALRARICSYMKEHFQIQQIVLQLECSCSTHNGFTQGVTEPI